MLGNILYTKFPILFNILHNRVGECIPVRYALHKLK